MIFDCKAVPLFREIDLIQLFFDHVDSRLEIAELLLRLIHILKIPANDLKGHLIPMKEDSRKVAGLRDDRLWLWLFGDAGVVEELEAVDFA